MLRFRKLKMQMKKLLKNNGIECRKAPQTERFAELFLYHMLRQHFSFRKCAAEYFADEGSGNDELEWQCHNQVLWNISNPYRKQQRPHAGFHTGFQTSIKGHDDDHGNHHTAGNSNGFLKRSTVRFNKKTECNTFSQM